MISPHHPSSKIVSDLHIWPILSDADSDIIRNVCNDRLLQLNKPFETV